MIVSSYASITSATVFRILCSQEACAFLTLLVSWFLHLFLRDLVFRSLIQACLSLLHLALGVQLWEAGKPPRQMRRDYMLIEF